MHRLLGGVAVLLLAGPASANSACTNGEGWALADGTTVTAHPRLVFYSDVRGGGNPKLTVTATLDGKPVKATVSFSAAPPFALAVIDVDTDRAGKLAITLVPDPGSYARTQKASYVIDPKLKLGNEAKGTTSRFHQAYRHSTVHELDDGLAVTIDQPAITFSMKWRTDDKAQWSTTEMTALTIDRHQVARIGNLGCSSNFLPSLLEHGIDLELTATLVDGSTIKVTGLPAHYTLPKLPADAPQSVP
jgi:hypothetical protein